MDILKNAALKKCRECGGKAEAVKEDGDWVIKCAQCSNEVHGSDAYQMTVRMWNERNAYLDKKACKIGNTVSYAGKSWLVINIDKNGDLILQEQGGDKTETAGPVKPSDVKSYASLKKQAFEFNPGDKVIVSFPEEDYNQTKNGVVVAPTMGGYDLVEVKFADGSSGGYAPEQLRKVDENIENLLNSDFGIEPIRLEIKKIVTKILQEQHMKEASLAKKSDVLDKFWKQKNVSIPVKVDFNGKNRTLIITSFDYFPGTGSSFYDPGESAHVEDFSAKWKEAGEIMSDADWDILEKSDDNFEAIDKTVEQYVFDMPEFIAYWKAQNEAEEEFQKMMDKTEEEHQMHKKEDEELEADLMQEKEEENRKASVKKQAMGPYCKFCGNRCFVPLSSFEGSELKKNYQGKADIIATCEEGQKYEKEKFGVCYDILIEQQKKKEASLDMKAVTRNVDEPDPTRKYRMWNGYRYIYVDKATKEQMLKDDPTADLSEEEYEELERNSSMDKKSEVEKITIYFDFSDKSVSELEAIAKDLHSEWAFANFFIDGGKKRFGVVIPDHMEQEVTEFLKGKGLARAASMEKMKTEKDKQYIVFEKRSGTTGWVKRASFDIITEALDESKKVKEDAAIFDSISNRPLRTVESGKAQLMASVYHYGEYTGDESIDAEEIDNMQELDGPDMLSLNIRKEDLKKTFFAYDDDIEETEDEGTGIKYAYAVAPFGGFHNSAAEEKKSSSLEKLEKNVEKVKKVISASSSDLPNTDEFNVYIADDIADAIDSHLGSSIEFNIKLGSINVPKTTEKLSEHLVDEVFWEEAGLAVEDFAKGAEESYKWIDKISQEGRMGGWLAIVPNFNTVIGQFEDVLRWINDAEGTEKEDDAAELNADVDQVLKIAASAMKEVEAIRKDLVEISDDIDNMIANFKETVQSEDFWKQYLKEEKKEEKASLDVQSDGDLSKMTDQQLMDEYDRLDQMKDPNPDNEDQRRKNLYAIRKELEKRSYFIVETSLDKSADFGDEHGISDPDKKTAKFKEGDVISFSGTPNLVLTVGEHYYNLVNLSEWKAKEGDVEINLVDSSSEIIPKDQWDDSIMHALKNAEIYKGKIWEKK